MENNVLFRELGLLETCFLVLHWVTLWPGVLQYSQVGIGLLKRYLLRNVSDSICQWADLELGSVISVSLAMVRRQALS